MIKSWPNYINKWNPFWIQGNNQLNILLWILRHSSKRNAQVLAKRVSPKYHIMHKVLMNMIIKKKLVKFERCWNPPHSHFTWENFMLSLSFIYHKDVVEECSLQIFDNSGKLHKIPLRPLEMVRYESTNLSMAGWSCLSTACPGHRPGMTDAKDWSFVFWVLQQANPVMDKKGIMHVIKLGLCCFFHVLVIYWLVMEFKKMGILFFGILKPI